jgi:hypothetical protein
MSFISGRRHSASSVWLLVRIGFYRSKFPYAQREKTSTGGDFATDSIGSIGSFTVAHSDIGTSLSQCDCGSDSATAASYKGNSILQIFHVCPVNPSVAHNPQSPLPPTDTEYHVI